MESVSSVKLVTVIILIQVNHFCFASVRVEHQGRAVHQYRQQEDVGETDPVQDESSSELLLVEFPKSGGLRRRKREWVIPPIRIMENDRKGPFPKPIARITSSRAKETKMVYSITGEGADLPPVGLFSVDTNTGEVSVSRPLDREIKDRYQLQAQSLSVTDNIKEPEMEVIIEVLDQNDNNPVFTQNLFTGSVPEASEIGFEFMTITATDADDPNTANADIRYSINSQIPPEPNPNIFEINPITGAIRVNAKGLDREKYPEYTLEIKAADMEGRGLYVIGKALITVTNGNDESSSELLLRELSKSGGLQRRKNEWVIPPIRIMENDRKGPFPKPITWITSSRAKETKMVYSITGEGADLPPVGLFSIDKNTGEISVSRPLDREIKDRYQLQAHAQSLSVTHHTEEPALELIIEVLDQNDNHPVFTQNLFTGSVPEASEIGFEFMTITATDADDPNTANADIRYSINSQIPPEPNPNIFEINPITGAIRVNAKGLDREKYPEYTLEIKAADMEGRGLYVIGKALITVTNGNLVIPPIFVTENYQRHLPKMIGQIKYSNPKINSVRYTIGGHGADLPPVGLFLIEKRTGEIFVARPLDRETKDKYVLQAHIIGDHFLQHDMMEFTINVVDQNDNKPVFTQDSFLGTISDASKIGHEFMRISATDADDPNTDNADIRYSIISQSPPEPHPNMFQVNPVSGVIQVNAEGLDSQKYPKYILKIQATDMQGEGFSSTGDAIISITDSKEEILNLSPGKWELSPICIPENSKGPFPKQLVKIKSNHAEEAKVVYSITGEGADKPPLGIFTMNKDTGWLSVTKPLDRETKHEYVLQAHASGDGVNEGPTEITVRVIDQNDNKPIFTQDLFRGSVSEASKIGFEVMTISATDADDPKIDNGIIRFSIISQDPALPQTNMFEISPFSGDIQVKAEGLDREKYPEYTLEIQAADMQGNGHQSTAKAVITVTA